MAATSQNLKDFFALTGDNPTVTNAQLQSVSDWLTEALGLDSAAGADDLVNYIYDMLAQQVVAYKRRHAATAF